MLVDFDDVYFMESNHLPMVPLPVCGRTLNGKITVQVKKGLN
jgi:hypothetical protein